MKRKIRTPYFEIGTKNYIYGDTVLEYAIAADKAAEGISDVLSIPHLTTALGLLSDEEGKAFISRVEAGESVDSVKKAIMEVLA